MTGNQLDRETSPYLLQHANNPVHWMAWGPDALRRAAEEDKPILLSVGYAACHWCHVMAHECFENPATATLMNDRFINIKVDREERPDIDSIYQHALQLMGQQGGWPLTMFLTPAGEPFWGGTYFPPESRFGRPGFGEVLEAISVFYRDKRDKVSESADSLRQALESLGRSRPGGEIALIVNDQVAERLVKEFDVVNGGIGTAPKFPNPSILELVWRGYIRTGNTEMRDAVTLTLDRMSQGGIYDHLGGGYARYSTDAAWLVPHFEKMLYDNAQILDLLCAAWQDTRSPLYAQRAEEMVRWLLREMVADGGAFAATLDADSEGEEGRFYVWSEPEIDAALGADAPLFKRAYGVTPAGNWEGKTILNRHHGAGPFSADDEAVLTRCRATLLDLRAGRVRPGWDDKVLADWNGLMIAALANAAILFRQPNWLDAARTAFGFINDKMWRGGRLLHSCRAGRPMHMATLDDYANMIRAAIALYEATAETGYLEKAEGWTEIVTRHFWDAIAGGYYFTADDAETLIVRAKHANDNATPAGNGVMAANHARLYYLTGNDMHCRRAEALIAAFSGEVAANFFPLATLLNASELLRNAIQIVIVGPRGKEDTEKLREAAFTAPAPNRIVLEVPPGSSLPASHPAAGKTDVSQDMAIAFVCTGQTCSLPITSAAALRAALGPTPSDAR